MAVNLKDIRFKESFTILKIRMDCGSGIAG
jgi:hypothetical protein